MEQGAGDLNPAPVAAIEQAHLVAPARAQLLALQFAFDALGRQLSGQAVQGGVVAQVLFDAEVQVQGALLEHHAEAGEGGARLAAQAVAADADLALLQVIEAGEQGDQGRLAGTVGAEQGGEAARRQAEAHLLQGVTRSIGEAHAGQFQGTHGVTTTPQG
ncbi:hypothetical protein D3C84_721560 [compost metagenome]